MTERVDMANQWHRGAYVARAAAVRAAANADPDTRCWRCRRTLPEVKRTNPRAHWTAGHLRDSDPSAPLAAECSPCNYSHGARYGNGLRAQGKRTGRPPRTVSWRVVTTLRDVWMSCLGNRRLAR